MKTQKQILKTNKGFTLVELMVVLAIIGVLMAIAIPNFIEYRTRGANRTAKTEAKSYYHTALVEVGDSGSATTFNAANLPQGFSANPDVTMVGSLNVPISFTVTGQPTFTHNMGSVTYTINNNGTVTP